MRFAYAVATAHMIDHVTPPHLSQGAAGFLYLQHGLGYSDAKPIIRTTPYDCLRHRRC